MRTPRLALAHLRAAACALLAAALIALPACRSAPAQIVEGQQYPEKIERGPTLDIQVFRRETTLEFTNTTATPIPASRLWLNAWYSRQFEGLGVGQTVRLPLREFKDRYGESFRGGGFFATELPERLALAELESGGKMVGMVVVGGTE
jgi:hypothetical protein